MPELIPVRYERMLISPFAFLRRWCGNGRGPQALETFFLKRENPARGANPCCFGQPAHVEDVAEAIARVMQRAETHSMIFECGGPRIYSYEELPRTIAREAGLKPILIPVTFATWHVLAWIAEMLPNPPVTRNQVALMQVDNVSSPQIPGFEALGISPRSVEAILQQMLRNR